MKSNLWLISLASVALSACAFDEGLIIEDMTGRVIIPRAAATRLMPNDETVEADARLIGPVTLGLYPEIKNDIYQYPHPEVGPAFSREKAGDTYPYGGTTVGDIRFPCLSDLVCRVTSGRYVDYDDLVDWYATYYQDPILDKAGVEVQSGEYIRQTCFQELRATSDEEVRFTATVDRDENGTIDTNDLQFVENADGDMEAEFTIFQQEFVPGFKLWGWMDSPSPVDGRLNTCDPLAGFNGGDYNDQFTGGVQRNDLLNYPNDHIQQGDWVVSDPFVYETVEDDVVLTLDFEVVE